MSSAPVKKVFSSLQFYTYFFCPYAHRSLIALIEAQLANKLDAFSSDQQATAITYHEVDLYLNEQLTDSFKSINPQGKVPTIRFKLNDGSNSEQELIINESLVINDFLQEVLIPELLPINSNDGQAESAYKKSLAKIWISYFDSNVNSLLFKLVFGEEPSLEKVKAEILTPIQDKLTFLVRNGFSAARKAVSEGPYFFGNHFSLVDIAYFPFVTRLEIILRHKYGLNLFEPFGNASQQTADALKLFSAWYENVKARESIQRSSFKPLFVPVTFTSNELKKQSVSGFNADIKELKELRKPGVISQDEFDTKFFDYEKYVVLGFDLLRKREQQRK
ncbi:hypothetical protein C9374_009917 [Naegleria lovaniensis]|uniref:GST N-terminal domain-containing protein n=1 Tax=Naegleria lovaniensis TaxID=51637 RepID=A0AA88GHC6_NAELO|nr:uncharacterized protein C9374_009917 [Naegleria lovaniensis]KAG2375294.1 hypothetical protein C9374_009917 [Naegleria lovaniensis]